MGAYFFEGLFPALRRAISACTASKVLRSIMASWWFSIRYMGSWPVLRMTLRLMQSLMKVFWLSTHILIEKCTQEKNSGAFLAFQGAFPKKQGALLEDFSISGDCHHLPRDCFLWFYYTRKHDSWEANRPAGLELFSSLDIHPIRKPKHQLAVRLHEHRLNDSQPGALIER